jgi:hypothetical protein
MVAPTTLIDTIGVRRVMRDPDVSVFRPIPRRGFIGALLAPAAALLVARRAAARPLLHAGRIGIVLADRSPEGMLQLGTLLGAEEAQHTAGLLRQPLEFVDVPIAELTGSAAAATRGLRTAAFDVIIAGLPVAALPPLVAAAGAVGTVVLNVAADDDALRDGVCDTPLFHITASRAMRRDAISEWLARGAADSRVNAVEWHPELRRFGAEQLNDRCIERFGVRMNAQAWLGWMAAKVAAEALFRAGGNGVAAHLLAARTRFDGHKGSPLGFRAVDQQLVQPLYIVARGADGAVLGEVPDSREAARTQLHERGVPATAEACGAHRAARGNTHG